MPPKKKNTINEVDLSTLSDRLDQLERIVGEKDNAIADLREKNGFTCGEDTPTGYSYCGTPFET